MSSKHKTLFKKPENPFYKELECNICKKHFWRINSKITKNKDKHYCSMECRQKCRILPRIKELTARCSKCNTWKNKDNFGFDKLNIYRKWCKECEHKERKNPKKIVKYKEYMRSYVYTIISRFHAVDRTKKYGKKFTQKEFAEWFKKQELKCTYCGIKEEKYGHPLGVDRKDSNICYTIENICLCCKICNTCKNNIFTHEEFKEIAKKYLSKEFRGNNRSIRNRNNSL